MFLWKVYVIPLSSGGVKARSPTSGPGAYLKDQPPGLQFIAILGFSERSCKIVILILIGKYTHIDAHTHILREMVYQNMFCFRK